jgi:hypothetical protein
MLGIGGKFGDSPRGCIILWFPKDYWNRGDDFFVPLEPKLRVRVE